MYSSNAYKCINDPLREQEKPHPFAFTTYFVAEAVHKLRLAIPRSEQRKRKDFWRGMKNVVAREFEQNGGGTELGCMSTSTSLEVVSGYAKSEQPLVMHIVSESFLSCGAEITWLSVYPTEAEALFPPLTYLKFDRKTQIKNSKGSIIHVTPIWSGL